MVFGGDTAGQGAQHAVLGHLHPERGPLDSAVRNDLKTHSRKVNTEEPSMQELGAMKWRRRE